MDIRERSVFYSTVRLICCLLTLLLVYPLQAETEAGLLKHPQGLLWKLHKNGQPDSYLFGTIHLADNRVLALLDEVQNALEQSDVFAMEVILDTAGQKRLTEATFFARGELLQDYIDDVMLDRINIIMHQYYGIPATTVNRMRPWAVMATISSPPPESNKAVLDVELELIAREQGKQVIALETIDEQIDVLSGMKLSEQLWILGKAVDDFKDSIPMWERLINSYLERNLTALVKEQLSLEDPDSTIDNLFMEKLLDQRNIKMAKRMDKVMKTRSLFAAIGALHLPGQKGVLQLLEKAGYQVEQVF